MKLRWKCGEARAIIQGPNKAANSVLWPSKIGVGVIQMEIGANYERFALTSELPRSNCRIFKKLLNGIMLSMKNIP